MQASKMEAYKEKTTLITVPHQNQIQNYIPQALFSGFLHLGFFHLQRQKLSGTQLTIAVLNTIYARRPPLADHHWLL